MPERGCRQVFARQRVGNQGRVSLPGCPADVGPRFSVLKAGYVVLTNAAHCQDADRKRQHSLPVWPWGRRNNWIP